MSSRHPEQKVPFCGHLLQAPIRGLRVWHHPAWPRLWKRDSLPSLRISVENRIMAIHIGYKVSGVNTVSRCVPWYSVRLCGLGVHLHQIKNCFLTLMRSIFMLSSLCTMSYVEKPDVSPKVRVISKRYGTKPSPPLWLTIEIFSMHFSFLHKCHTFRRSHAP